MLLNSLEFLIFFPIVTLLLFVMPKKLRVAWMVVVSLTFFAMWDVWNLLFIVFTILSTYLCATLLGRLTVRGDSRNARRVFLAITILFNIGIIAVTKYLGILTAPIGVSFYTLQAIGYLIDVYREKTSPEKNILKYSLFVSFFLLIESGPIERSTNLLKQIRNAETIVFWNFERVRDGFVRIIWGVFLKLVLADRMAILVDRVYGNYEGYGAVGIILASLMFSFQIYCDFSGYSHMAIGAAKIMGFEIMENFKQPYLATSIKEFWRRWHISLTSWLTDYIYISLGGNRKGLIRKYINIVIVFLVSGIWHGRGLNFLAWGLLHGIYQIIGDCKNRHTKYHLPKGLAVVVNFSLVNFAWFFFASSGLGTALRTIMQIFSGDVLSGIGELGLVVGDYVIIGVGLLLVLLVGIAKEKGVSMTAWLSSRFFVIRLIAYVGIFCAIVMVGIYGIGYDTSNFMYVQF